MWKFYTRKKLEQLHTLKKREKNTLTDNYEEADVAIMLLHPKSGSYFNATFRLLEIDVCEDKVVTTLDGSLYQETILNGMNNL